MNISYKNGQHVKIGEIETIVSISKYQRANRKIIDYIFKCANCGQQVGHHIQDETTIKKMSQKD